MGIVLALSDLEQFDPNAPSGRRERRFCCPLCGTDKRVDRAHRSISVNIETGFWKCHRCNLDGKLKDYWENKPKEFIPRREKARVQVSRIFAVRSIAQLKSASPPTQEEIDKENRWRSMWGKSVMVKGTRGEEYLASRSISIEAASAASVQFSSDWYFRRPAVVFPIHDRKHEVVAVTVRYVDGVFDSDLKREKFPIERIKNREEADEGLKTRTAGSKIDGVFWSSPSVFEADCIAITEAPIDALALSMCGIASIALIGTSWPDWLPAALAFKSMLLASDNDKAGDELAEKLEEKLSRFGAHCLRLKPKKLKDWAEQLEHFGLDMMRERLRTFAIQPTGGENSDITDDDIRLAAIREAVRREHDREAEFIVRLCDQEMRGTASRFRRREIARRDTEKRNLFDESF